jgi:archaemetzincin
MKRSVDHRVLERNLRNYHLRSLQTPMKLEIKIHPFHDINPLLLTEITKGIEGTLPIKTTIGANLPIAPHAFSNKRQQHSTSPFLQTLNELNQRESQIRLGITDVDLFVPDLNFVFGEADPKTHVAVFSIVRLDPRSYGELANSKLLVRRALTEAIHELGHILGLKHCNNDQCVMWFSNTLAESDRKGPRFCSRCVHNVTQLKVISAS